MLDQIWTVEHKQFLWRTIYVQKYSYVYICSIAFMLLKVDTV